jgi:hypothetical protein
LACYDFPSNELASDCQSKCMLCVRGIVKKKSYVVRVLSANASLVVMPASNFLLVTLLTRYSLLATDTAYYFLAAWIGLMTLFDGGRALKVHAVKNKMVVYRVIAIVSANLYKVSFPVWIVICIVISGAPFAKRSSIAVIVLCGAATVVCGFVKILADTLRTLALRSGARMQADWLASAFAIGRVAAAWIFLNKFAYPFTYFISVVVEFLVLMRLVGVPLKSIPRLLRPRIRRGFSAHWDYVRVNLAYLASVNVDRIFAYYFIDERAYKNLILATSILNVSIMPHKLIENEIVFPSKRRVGVLYSVDRPSMLALMMASVGAVVIGCGFRIVNSGDNFDTALNVMVASIWLAVTLVYNKTWANLLHSGRTDNIARRTLIAGGVSFFAPFFLFPLYWNMIPVALFAYGMANMAALSVRDQSVRNDGLLYLLVIIPGCLFGWQLMGLF